jgi:hypothetical protein
MSSKDGFRIWFDKAARIGNELDWTPHTVDYVTFKQTLKSYAERRSRLRKLLRESEDHRLPEELITNILHTPGGPVFVTSTTTQDNNGDEQHIPDPHIPLDITTTYVPFAEDLESCSHSEAGDSHSSTSSSAMRKEGRGGKRKTKRSIMRRVSIVERKEMLHFLSMQLDKAHVFYMSQWQVLSEQLDRKRAYFSMLELQKDLGDAILELFAFCVINVVTIRQILIRYDAFARTFEGCVIEY